MPGTKASAMPASSNRIAGAILTRRANSAVPASTASRIRKIWNLASMPSTQRRGAETSVPQIVPVGLGNDLPAVRKLHRHQVVGEVARGQLAAHLDEGGGLVGPVDGDYEVFAGLALGLGGRPLAHPCEPVRHGEDLEFPLFHPTQVGGRVEHGAELVGIAIV